MLKKVKEPYMEKCNFHYEYYKEHHLYHDYFFLKNSEEY